MAVTHTEEFRREAVRIALSNGLSRTCVAADLGIGKSILGHWISQYRTAELPVPELQTDLARENERLRLENRVFREEREILKKATQFFASQKT
ncbi:transposase [Gluconobacter cerinus]|uniref:transposase n=1 Tax=Gluconobacter cerinus TaxID=38307 RepID=UPI001B8AE775|nr:transposase [Gluconobacter cerinus]MBS0984629.1 transposase [Gluconobacter cerinus]